MPKFSVTAKDAQGKAHVRMVDAQDVNTAVVRVQAEGLFVMDVRPWSEAEKSIDIKALVGSHQKFTHKGVRLADIVSFAKQLSTMLESGVPLLRSLSVIAGQVESEVLAKVLQEVKLNVEQGQPFSAALGKHPKYFGQFWVSLVEVGEASGTLPQVLQKLTSYMEQAEAFRSQIIGALIYPGVLFFICICAVLFFALFVGPTFENIFKDMNASLPGITIFMLATFDFIKTKFLWIVGGLFGTFFLLKRYIQTDQGRRQYEAMLLRMPVFGPIVRLIIVEKFTSQMAILVDTGVPILYALEIAERLVDNLICGEVIKGVREAVKEGKLLSDPMEESGFFPSMAVQMIRVGEETGELSKMLNHVANYYKTTVEEFMKRFGTLIEPFMLVFMGAVIGVIVISMFLPLFNLAGGGV